MPRVSRWQGLKFELKFFISVTLVSIGQTWVFCQYCHNHLRAFVLVSLFCLCMWFFLWRGNARLTDYTNSKISWLEQPIKRFVVGMISTIAYTAGTIVATMYVFKWLFDFDFGDSLKTTIVISIVITLLISFFLHAREFFFNWRKLELDAVRLRNENLTSKYESLKSQLDPHFLFNSLNVLTNLVYADADKSARFIKQLSEVYRYVLEVRNKELVPLEEELRFVESYLYLQQIRFGDKLRVENKLEGLSGLIPPLALQILVENAIKHNVISEDDPLTIKMYVQDNEVVVENNFQKKTRLTEGSTGIGLDNISKRYEFLSNKRITILETPSSFLVKLPLLQSS
ncbi:MAG TPA: histidine kinase [Cyclobacteriaceae bacterium]|nr:histidine kinase [Cyclobacteriaceae bacterium]HMV10670.1 histidine kinase [Cyclobacteriaceae bacterium]HMV90898.1 histidine kinase [Cyclobacteriaceae bacterium]HMX02531.1 histidine kinase [Cyclobacteriaceae bacterium]HMX50753.1 histidine kinase [Cyclobacteriaceae bacterium]